VSESTPVLLIGAGGHCKSCINLIESIPLYNVEGIIDKKGSLVDEVLSYKVLGTDNDLESLLALTPTALIAVGQIKSANLRIDLFRTAKDKGAQFPIFKSPHACISNHSVIGPGTAVFHQVIVNASAKVGENCILNNKALIEHDVKIGSHCHISTGSLINGGVIIEDGCFVGSGAVLHEGIKVGENSVISAGKVVREDLSMNTIYR
jgi:sugar O-acyltransferase (sialic acid O-acetyltransferase NeuD family)